MIRFWFQGGHIVFCLDLNVHFLEVLRAAAENLSMRIHFARKKRAARSQSYGGDRGNRGETVGALQRLKVIGLLRNGPICY